MHMVSNHLFDPLTARASQSIWEEIRQDSFRLHLVELEKRTNGVPTGPEVFSALDWQDGQNFPADVPRLLPILMEQSLANDFAFLAAIEEGAQSVAAVCIEEHVPSRGMTIRFAAMDIIKEPLQLALRNIFGLLEKYAAVHQLASSDTSFGEVSGSLIKLHHLRIIARLRSAKWHKPQYLSESRKKPLWKDFKNLIHRTQFLYTRKESKARQRLQNQLQDLASLYEGFETIPGDSDAEIKYVMEIVQKSFDLCVSEDTRSFVKKLESVGVTSQVAAAIKCIRQIEKIAVYWRIPKTLISAAGQYPTVFQRIHLTYLRPYASIPTSITFEIWAKSCHVHAEVQLVVYYDLHRSENSLSPRCIGTSKYLCFLCYAFIKFHGDFFPANTHGRLYDQWTIPDLADYNELQREKYRRVIRAMDQDLEQRCRSEPKWRPEPMTSRQDFSDVDLASKGSARTISDLPKN